MSIDLNNVKEQIQAIFEAANTTTASVDLSSGLETRVQKILKVNPGRIPIQSSWYPFVSIYIDNKSISAETFAVNQSTGKRKGLVEIKVIGAVWNSSIIGNEDLDPADEDCEDLMESIEQILRANPTLGGVATWSFPNLVSYHNANLDEGVHIRAGILNVIATIFY